MPTPLVGPRQRSLSGERPKSLVILLHGVGADGDDMIGLAPLWAGLLPETEFLCPSAPFPWDMAPTGRQWFSLQDRDPAAIFSGIKAVAPILDAFIDEALAARGLAEDRLALVGFSQGTAMALYVGLRRKQALAGIVGFSGALCGPEYLQAEIKSRPNVLLIHGDADPIVPFAALAEAAQGLAANRVPVDTMVCPGLGHGIDDAGLARAGEFLRGAIG